MELFETQASSMSLKGDVIGGSEGPAGTGIGLHVSAYVVGSVVKQKIVLYPIGFLQ